MTAICLRYNYIVFAGRSLRGQFKHKITAKKKPPYGRCFDTNQTNYNKKKAMLS
jgi:hypothetical protein